MSTPLRWLEDTAAYRWAVQNEYLISNEEITSIRWRDETPIAEALRREPGVDFRRLIGPAFLDHAAEEVRTQERSVVRRPLEGPTYMAVFPDGSTIYDHPASFSTGWGMAPNAEEAERELRREIQRIEAENAFYAADDHSSQED